jgi:hypothetical protein
MDYPIYIYNTLSSTLIFSDTGMEIPAMSYYEITNKLVLDNLSNTTEFGKLLKVGSIILTTSDSNTPPLNSDILSSETSIEISDQNTYSGEIIYNSTSSIKNVQGALDDIYNTINTIPINIDGGKPSSTYGTNQHLNGGKP